MDLDPRETLKECATAHIKTFLHWMVKVYTIKKTSIVTTYWRQLSQPVIHPVVEAADWTVHPQRNICGMTLWHCLV
jgi:hypothetical protein